jgi:uncharacterized membrane protein (DUF4010 family)
MNGEFDLLVNLAIALGLGALIGSEREITEMGRKQRSEGVEFSGLRTYTLISLLGFLSVYVGKIFGGFVFVAILLIVGGFLLSEYIRKSQENKFFGITHEMAALATFIVGSVSAVSPLIATTVAVAVVLILALKNTLRGFIQTLDKDEFLAAIKFIVIAFVVLPLLPNETIDSWGLVNPHNAWLMVVLISAISFVGYVLVKAVGVDKGLGITGLVGGLISSTAVTSSMSEQSKQNRKVVNPFTLAVIIAGGVMFVRVGLEVFVVNRELLPKLSVILGSMLIATLLGILVIWRRSSAKEQKKKTSKDLEVKSPFKLSPALKFGIFYLFILAIADLANQYFGSKGIYLAATFSGLADVDAITLSLSNLAKEGSVMNEVAIKGITIAVLVNTFVKLMIVRIFGSKEFFKQALLAFGVVLGSGVLAVLLV